MQPPKRSWGSSGRRARRLPGAFQVSFVPAAILVALLAPLQAGAGRFSDVTTSAGLSYLHQSAGWHGQIEWMAGGVAAGDYDDDGWIDLFAVGGEAGTDKLLHNQGDGTFVDVAESAGVALSNRLGAGPLFADLDGDGWLDLLVLAVGGDGPRLFRSRGDGSFADATATSGLTPLGHGFSAAAGDYDRDGDLDLFIARWGSPLSAGSAGHLWRNDGSLHFTDVSAPADIPAFSSRIDAGLTITTAFTPNFADIDNDGWPDLLVAADFGGSRVLHNNHDGTFTDATTSVITDENGMGAAVGDIDNDGDLDWFVSSIFDPNGVAEGHWFVSGNRLYRNDGSGGFVEATDTAGVRVGYWGWGSTFADFDNDGFLDLFHVNGFGVPGYAATAEFIADPSRLFMNDGNGTFSERAAFLGLADTGNGRGVVAFDYDRDGDIDLFVANNDQAPRLFRNDGDRASGREENRPFLRVEPRGLPPNTRAIGARIYVKTGSMTQMREIRAGSNFESQDPVDVHFGLAGALRVDELRVVWPDGQSMVRNDIAANRSIRLVQTSPAGTRSCRADAPDNPCTPGRGRLRNECLLELIAAPTPSLDAAGAPRSVLRCRDGDAACDRDGDAANASCTFSLAVCVNNIDPRLSDCSPALLSAPTIRTPNAHSQASSLDSSDAQNLASLSAVVGAMVTATSDEAAGSPRIAASDRCSGEATIIVPIRRLPSMSTMRGQRTIRLGVESVNSLRSDTDAIRFECLAASPL